MDKKKLALFDFDGTLTKTDTFIQFAIFAVGRIRFLLAMMKSFIPLAAWKLGLISNDKAKEKLFKSLYKGMDLQEFDSKCNDFSDIIDDSLNKHTFEEMRRHIDGGSDVYIVSASIENWIRPWALKHGLSNVVGTKIETDTDGRLTGRFLSKNCYGAEKLNRIKDIFPDIDSFEIWTYGDSKGDAEIMRIADHPHMI